MLIIKNNNIKKEYLTTDYWMKDLNNSKEQVDDLKKIDIVIDEKLEKNILENSFY